MKRIRLYYPAEYQLDASIELTGDAFHHGVKVMRCRVGDRLELFNGAGFVAFAELIDIQKRSAMVVIRELSEVSRESPLNTILVQAVSKGERMDWVLQKSVEIGVTTIQPVISERCNVHLDPERWQKRMLHWQRVIVSACEQCGRNHLPSLKPVINLPTWVQENSLDQIFILHPKIGARMQTLKVKQSKQLGFIIGPEGGFSDEEVELCISSGVKGINLGPRVLRTETAGIAVLAIAQSLWGDG